MQVLLAPIDLAPGKEPRRRMGGPENRYGPAGEEKNPCPCRETNPDRPARSLVTTLTEIYRLHRRQELLKRWENNKENTVLIQYYENLVH
jgi:hypothetical protein